MLAHTGWSHNSPFVFYESPDARKFRGIFFTEVSIRPHVLMKTAAKQEPPDIRFPQRGNMDL